MNMNLIEAIIVLFLATSIQIVWKYESFFVYENVFRNNLTVDKELAIFIGLNSWILAILFYIK